MSLLVLVLVSSVAGTLVHSAAIDSSDPPVVQNPIFPNGLTLVTTAASATSFRDCFNVAGLVECLRSVAVRSLTRAIESNVPVRVTRFLVIRRNQDFVPEMQLDERAPPSDWSTIFTKVRDLISSRTLQFRLTGPDGRSMIPSTFSSILGLPTASTSPLVEGRGKKHKHKHQQGGMYMMGGVAFMAMMAQLVLGKVAMLAAVALILAKIALVFSTLNGFKKAAGGGGGGGAEHVVYEHGSGGAGGGGGWQRSIDPKYNGNTGGGGGGGGQYDYDDGGPYRRRRPDYDYSDPLDGA